MRNFEDFPPHLRNSIRYVLADIDDTLTVDGLLPSSALAAMERLSASGRRTVPITGRPAGWCDHIARMWPVAAVVGENGAFYFRYDRGLKKMLRVYFKPRAEREADRRRLAELKEQILHRVPGAALSADQPFREADLAVDFCEDVPPLPAEAVDAIVACFESAGARAKISSIHVNGWFGDYDKLIMTRRLFAEAFGEDLDAVKSEVVFVGDSPNDEPMFAFFPHAVGVANVQSFLGRMQNRPAWVTRRPGGFGFAEMAETLLS